ncbi:uracil-DNA glycosylase [Rhodobacteraceae bacterium RKSG542]|uniref:uracil-DNA glycosylase n=1 Tax=Pseudovibrio flavus TaxID=2529854 RepID=UPI0012BB8348|nr:uracil-DNA glycosylase [Pseudovibrio flavus]MTI18700.1 uracil-DNA glycosylase [Pseudovibrio flavus]
MTETHEIDSAQLEAYLEFLVAAGFDCCLDDAPVDRFTVSAEVARQPASVASAMPSDFREPEQPRGRTVSVPNRPPEDFDAHKAAQTILQRQKQISDQAGSSVAPIGSGAVVPDAQAVSSAREMASKAGSLDELRAILADFHGCNLRLTAKNLVFGDGNPNARVMFVGEAPGRDEDLQGVPFVGRSGQLLNRMLAAAGMERSSVYIANVVPWRPPGNRAPTPQETEICRPFIQQQIELVNPDFVVFLGAASAKTLSGASEGIRRLRGRWISYASPVRERRAMATFHPAYLLRSPLEKRYSWRDLLALREALADK